MGKGAKRRGKNPAETSQDAEEGLIVRETNPVGEA
jgi:hypothetical protein